MPDRRCPISSARPPLRPSGHRYRLRYALILRIQFALHQRCLALPKRSDVFDASALSRWLELARGDAILKNPDDINAEARSNLWTFSPNEDESCHISGEDLQSFVLAILEARRQWMTQHALQGMIFYCWHDAQIRALRLSLVSRSHGRLPFGCKIRTVENLLDITGHIVEEDWSNDKYADDSADTTTSSDLQYVLPVWRCGLG